MNIKKQISALRPFGDVLEVGFGPSSKEIQTYHPRTHTILSTDPDAKLWAQDHPSVKVIEDVWQGALPSLGIFHTIFFGIDPQEHNFLLRFRYSDADLDPFCEGIEDKKVLSRFLAELERNEQITSLQKEKMIKKYHLEYAKPPPFKRSSEMIQFFKQCMSSHMEKGSRFSMFLKSEIDDPLFFEEILVNPFLEVHQDGKIVIIERQ